jgi:5,10-methylenetetrahydromethanopterin reductase
MPVELWTAMASVPGHVAGTAARAEAAGWDGVTITDSQNLVGDTYVAMTVAAAATSRLRVSTGVTNPWTRHPAVTAAAIWHIQIESHGRAVLGLGRGDSSLAHIGLAPAPVDALASYLEDVQTYLRGEPVPLGRAAAGGHRPIEGNLPVADRPADSRLHWLALGAGLPKPPVFVVASGPRVLRVAASLADRVVLAVGADPDRVRWAIGVVRAVRPEVAVGAYVNVVVDDDVERGRALAAGGVASFGRFSAMHGRVAGPLGEEERAVLEAIPQRYDLNRHFQSAPHAQNLPAGFIDRFAVVGSPARCVDRLAELVELGVDQLHVVGPTADADRDAAGSARRRFREEVLPALRS